MAVTYGFFNSINGDRKYNADQMSDYFRGIVNQGVFQHLDNGLAVSAGTGMEVNVATGRAIVQNKWIQNDMALPLTIEAASDTYGRKDAVVIRLSYTNRSISIVVKTGTPAASPTAPSMTRNSTTYEMALAYVNVAANATSVTVTDKRSDSSVCGWATVAQETSGEVDQMLNDMKTGFDGVVYPSPAAMVTSCDQKLQGEIDDIISHYEPTNYGDIDSSDLVVGASSLVGRVTATDNPDGGIDVINGAGANGQIGFALDDLAYGTSTIYDIKVEFTGMTSYSNIDMRSGMSSGDPGTARFTLTQSQESPNIYEANNFNILNYNYSTNGKLYFSFNLRYNQTSAVNVKLSIIIHGDVARDYISTDMLFNISENNLSNAFRNQIDLVSGSKPTLYGGEQIRTFNKGLAIGDSLTAGVFNYNEGGTTGYVTNALYSFPAKLKQMTGVDVVNLGEGGKTSDEWYELHKNDDLSGNQFAIIQLGVNDAIQYSGWTNTSSTAFTNIINKLLTENPGIFIFVATIIPATSYSGSAYNAVSDGIRTLVSTLANNHVILLDMAVYGNTGAEVGYNNGHLSALGYERLAKDYMSYISYIISNNYELFRNIQFIGTSHSYL